jgi:hypothetical protein
MVADPLTADSADSISSRSTDDRRRPRSQADPSAAPALAGFDRVGGLATPPGQDGDSRLLILAWRPRRQSRGRSPRPRTSSSSVRVEGPRRGVGALVGRCPVRRLGPTRCGAKRPNG